jgi:hypothetical protein
MPTLGVPMKLMLSLVHYPGSNSALLARIIPRSTVCSRDPLVALAIHWSCPKCTTIPIVRLYLVLSPISKCKQTWFHEQLVSVREFQCVHLGATAGPDLKTVMFFEERLVILRAPEQESRSGTLLKARKQAEHEATAPRRTWSTSQRHIDALGAQVGAL